MVGSSLSHYKIIEKIGQGGMGEVYRAEDTTLKREVAIKVLPEQFTKDPQRLARFEREAQLLAQLNHPNIAAIHGLEEHDGQRFLVLELVEGDTLHERIKKGALPVEEALEVCRQIAEGVEAAHEKGVIHRDLKPANVMVTPQGKVKILDFGLAKAFEEEVRAADMSQSPTLTDEMTRAGVILGTAAYMSPEQAKGKPLDKRADVFSFGAILFELLTRRRAFQGETITETLAKILEGEPDWAKLPANTPSIVRSLLRRCLQKDQDRRLRDIGDARIEIEDALADPSGVPVQSVPEVAQPARQSKLPWVAAILVSILIAGFAAWNLRPEAPRTVSRSSYLLPEGQQFTGTGRSLVDISPDGSRMVYVANRQLYLRAMDALEATPIPGTNSSPRSPFFSPDGQWIGYWSQIDGQLKKIAVSGGAPVTLSETGNPYGAPSWGTDNRIIWGQSGGVMKVSANGGTPEVLIAREEANLGTPQILPDGESVLLSRGDRRSGEVVVYSLESEEPKVLFDGVVPKYVPTGHIVYSVDDVLFAVPFDLDTLEVVGGPVAMVEGVRATPSQYSISESGALIYAVSGTQVAGQYSLVWVDREGNETAVTQEKREYAAPRVSPDGSKLVHALFPSEATVETYDFELDSFSRLTFEGTPSGSPVWSPDGEWVIFQISDPGRRYMVRQPADRSAPPEPLTQEQPQAQQPNSWSPDGRFLLFNQGGGPGGGWDIFVLELEQDSEPQPFVSTAASEGCAVFSPDGRWVAYVSDESGSDQVFLRPFPGPDVKFLVSGSEGGGQPVWSPSGSELFYRSGNRMMVVSVETEPTVRTGRPQVLFEGDYRESSSTLPGYQYYDISPDGQRFVMIKEDRVVGSRPQINIVLNWFEEVKERAPTN